MSDRPNIILCNLRAFYLLFWDKKRVLTQDEKEIAAFNDNIWVDSELEKFLQRFEKHFRKLVFKKRVLYAIRHPLFAAYWFRRNPYWLFDMNWNITNYPPYGNGY